MLHDAVDQASVSIVWVSRWVPPSIAGVLVMLLAALIAASLCNFLLKLLFRLGSRYGRSTAMLAQRCRGPTCALLVLLALGVVLPVAPFSDRTTDLIGKALLAATALVLGWTAINSTDLFADLYLGRFQMDVEDNLIARKHATQIGILRGAMRVLIILVTIGAALMTSASVRQYGVSLFASAGAAGLVVGLAARPLLSNLLAGIQIAITQPIRLEDAVVIEGEWGWIERIGATYVVLRIWDQRRLIVPLSYFIEQPFANWTHQSADLLGTVFFHVDYSVPVDRVREKLREVAEASSLWDRKVAIVQVTDLPESMVELRILVSARNSPTAFDLRCEVREKIMVWLYQEYPDALPRNRAQISAAKPLDLELAMANQPNLEIIPRSRQDRAG